MEKNKIVQVVELRGQAEQLKKTLTDLQKDFAGIAAPKELDKIFSKLGTSIDTILRKTEKGLMPREEFADTEKEIGKVKTSFESLITVIEALGKAGDKKLASLIPEGTVQKLNAVEKAYNDYSKTVAQVAAAEQKLEEANIKKAEATKKAIQAERSFSAYKGNKTKAEKEVAKHEEVTKALKNQVDATKALERAQKDLDTAKATGASEKTINTKAGKVSSAQSAKNAADAVVSGFTKKQLEAEAEAQRKLTEATDKYTAAEKEATAARKAKNAAAVAAQGAEAGLKAAQTKSQEQLNKEVAALTKLKEALVAVNPKYKDLTIEGENTSEQLKFLKNIVDGLSEDELKKLKVSLESANVNFGKFTGAVNSTKEALSRTKAEIKANDEAAAQAGAFESKIKQFLGLAGAAEVLRRSLRDALSTITELDKTMTEMAVVTELSVGDYWDQLPEYTKQASELGVAVNDAYRAATLYYQQGLKGNEVTKVSAQTLKLAKIANLDAKDATDKMTAALRGFNMEVNEMNAERVADVYSKLAAITAADVKEISSAMTKTASIASSAGMEFETTAAFLSQIIETTRESAETAGTAMKTIIARFQELKKAPEEIGEIDGEIVDANAIEGALRSVGVALRDSSGQFRELDSVFMELSQKWDTLDTNTQRYIATIAAGSRQQSRFIAMMSDYGRTQELVAAANNSSGASSQQFGKTLESLESKIEKLKNAWHEFTMGIMNSDLVKWAVDTFTLFLTIVNKATSGFKGLAGSITKIASVIAIFKLGSKVFEKFKQPLMDLFSWVVDMAGGKGYQAGVKYTTEMKRGMKDSLASEIADNQMPQESVSNNKRLALISEGRAILGRQDDLRQKIDSNRSWLDDKANIDKYNNAQISSNKLQEDLKIQDNLRLDAKQKQAKFLNTRGASSIEDLKDEDKEIFKSLQKREKDAETAYGEISNAIDENTKSIKEYEDKLNETNNLDKKFTDNSTEGWKKIREGVQQVGTSVAGVGMGISMLGGIFSSLGLEEVGEIITKIGNGVTLLGTAISALGPIATSLVEKLVKGGWSVQAAWWWVAAIGAAIVVLVSAISKVAADIKKASPEAKLERAAEAAEAAAQAADEMAAAYHNLVDSLEGIDSQYDTIEDMVYGTKEWQKAVESVNDEVLGLIEEYPELAKFVKNKGGILTIDMDSAEVQQVIAEAREVANNARTAATMAEIGRISVQRSNEYGALDNSAKLNYIDPNSAYWAAYSGAVAAGTGAGAAGGAAIGGSGGTAVLPVIGTVGGGAVGGVVGGVIGGGTVILIGGADAAGSAAKEAAENHNKQGQLSTETIARALAAGAIVDTGSGYEATEMLSTDFLIAEDVERLQTLMSDTSGWEGLYAQLKGSTEALKEFGTTLNKTSKAEEAQYESLWFQIYNNMNKSGWSEDAKAVGEGAFGAALPSAVAADVWDKYSDVDFLDKNLSDENQKALNQALEQQYGAGARLTEDAEGNQIIVDGNGKTVVDQVNNELLQSLVVASQTATEVEARAAKIPQMTEEVVRGVSAAMSSNTGAEGETTVTGDSKDIREAIITALSDQTGESMTFDMAEMFKGLTSEEIKAIYNSSSALQELYADVTLFEGVLKTAPNSVEESRKKVEEFFNGFPEWASGLTAKVLNGLMDETRLGAIQSKGTTGEQERFNNIFNTLMDSENAEGIATYLNGLDWTNEKQLLHAQYVLQDVYGVSAEQAKEFTEATIAATDATMGLTEIVTDFDAFERALKRIESALQEFNNLQWEYEHVLKNSGDAAETAVNLEKQRQAALQAAWEADQAYTFARENQVRKYGEGATVLKDHDLSRDVRFDPNTNSYDFTEFYNYLRTLNPDTQEYKDALKWGQELESLNKTANEQNDAMRDAYELLEQIDEDVKQGYQNLWSQVGDALTSSMEKQLEAEEELLDATKEANDRLVSKTQEQIDDTRQARENEKAEEEIGDMYSRLSYLGMDTSGANALEMLALEKQIAEAEESYQDSLVDQAIQSLQDANDQAYEQRERQISLAEQQLEAYQGSDEHQAEIQQALDGYMAEYQAYEEKYQAWQFKQLTREDYEHLYGTVTDEEKANLEALGATLTSKPTFKPEDTELGSLMISNGVLLGMSELEKNDFWTEMALNTALAADYLRTVEGETTGTSSSKKGQAGLLDEIRNNTALENLVALQYGGEFSAAKNRTNSFSAATGFTLGGNSNLDSYLETDPTTGNKKMTSSGAANAADYLATNQAAGTEANTKLLQDSNIRASGLAVDTGSSAYDESKIYGKTKKRLDLAGTYGSYLTPEQQKGLKDRTQDTLLTQKEFYDRLNRGETVTLGTGDSQKTYTQERLTTSLANGSTDGSYETYLQDYNTLYKYDTDPNTTDEWNTTPENSLLRTGIENKVRAEVKELQKEPGFDGLNTLQKKSSYQSALQDYLFLGGDIRDFQNNVLHEPDGKGGWAEYITYGYKPDVTWDIVDETSYKEFSADEINNKGKMSKVKDEDIKNQLSAYTGLPADGGGKSNPGSHAVLYDDEVYLFWPDSNVIPRGGGLVYDYYWYKVDKGEDNGGGGGGVSHRAYKRALHYKTGGLADFTGPAWLDGTKSKPEIVLNQRDSANFIVLRDILGEVLQGASTINNSNSQQKGGDNHFDIDINVEKIDSDYDVEQIANKIRSMIYEDAAYRNVQSIGFMR